LANVHYKTKKIVLKILQFCVPIFTDILKTNIILFFKFAYFFPVFSDVPNSCPWQFFANDNVCKILNDFEFKSCFKFSVGSLNREILLMLEQKNQNVHLQH